MKVGFVGLGLMGGPMARRLLAAGHELRVTSRRRGSAADLEGSGAEWAATPRDCAVDRDLVVLMLPDVATVEYATLGPDGVLAGAPAIVVDMSTTAPQLSERIAAHATAAGLSALDAPVSGGPPGAESGTLSIMVGGDPATFATAEPLLSELGTPRLLGPPGSGQRTKLVNQLLVAATASGVAEAWALASRLGLDPAAVHEVVSGGIAGGRLLEFMWPRLMNDDAAPGFKIDQMIKDLQLALVEADDGGLDLTTARGALRRYQELSAGGAGELGTQALVRHHSLHDSLHDSHHEDGTDGSTRQ